MASISACVSARWRSTCPIRCWSWSARESSTPASSPNSSSRRWRNRRPRSPAAMARATPTRWCRGRVMATLKASEKRAARSSATAPMPSTPRCTCRSAASISASGRANRITPVGGLAIAMYSSSSPTVWLRRTAHPTSPARAARISGRCRWLPMAPRGVGLDSPSTRPSGAMIVTRWALRRCRWIAAESGGIPGEAWYQARASTSSRSSSARTPSRRWRRSCRSAPRLMGTTRRAISSR